MDQVWVNADIGPIKQIPNLIRVKTYLKILDEK